MREQVWVIVNYLMAGTTIFLLFMALILLVSGCSPLVTEHGVEWRFDQERADDSVDYMKKLVEIYEDWQENKTVEEEKPAYIEFIEEYIDKAMEQKNEP